MPLLHAALQAAGGGVDSHPRHHPGDGEGVMPGRGIFDGDNDNEEQDDGLTSQVESDQSGPAYDQTGATLLLSLLSAMSALPRCVDVAYVVQLLTHLQLPL